MGDQRKAVGRRGEDAAVHYLRAQGHRILFRNYRTRIGEIDIITEHESVIVFVEVRSKRTKRFGTGAESVHFGKQNKIRQVAQWFISQNGYSHRPCRFDVIDVFFDPEPTITHIINAF